MQLLTRNVQQHVLHMKGSDVDNDNAPWYIADGERDTDFELQVSCEVRSLGGRSEWCARA